ncbi:MAG TPA: hypothetical protein VGB96_13085 [Archangium sp.]
MERLQAIASHQRLESQHSAYESAVSISDIPDKGGRSSAGMMVLEDSQK